MVCACADETKMNFKLKLDQDRKLSYTFPKEHDYVDKNVYAAGRHTLTCSKSVCHIFSLLLFWYFSHFDSFVHLFLVFASWYVSCSILGKAFSCALA